METINATQSSFHSILNEPKEATMQEEYKGYVSSDYARRLEETNLELRKQIEQHTAPVPFDLNALLLTALAPVVQHMTAPLLARIAVLEEKLDNIKDASDERIKEIAEEVAEQAIDAHKYDYDHDEYDRLFNDLGDKIDEAINDLDLEDKLRDALRGMTFDITARY